MEDFMRAFAMVFAVFALSLPAAADESAPAEAPAAPPPEVAIAFGAGHPECQEWTDGCMVCKRVGETVACSTPGIACLPVQTICSSPAK